MTRLSSALLLAAITASTQAFAPVPPGSMQSIPYFANPDVGSTSVMENFPSSTKPISAMPEQPAAPAKKAAPTKKAAGGHGKSGIFAPVVVLAKNIVGEEELNKIRGKAIGLHSKVIGGFVDTHETPIGETALRALFQLADVNKNGSIEEEELATALRTLGFDLKENQIKGIFERADKDGNGVIDFEEWRKEAPSTLRTNLIKLAKRNGGELGFLA